jgi:hypothetical protein
MVKRFLVGLGLVLAGAIAALAVLYIGIGGGPRTPEAERAVRDRYILDYTKDEQEKRGIDCRKLKSNLAAFLQQKLDPVVRARKPGQKWDALVSDDLKRETEKFREYILTCSMLYKAGRNGEANGLRELSYIAAIEDAFLTLEVLIRHGAPSQNCGPECIDNRFRELESAYRRVLTVVA